MVLICIYYVHLLLYLLTDVTHLPTHLPIHQPTYLPTTYRSTHLPVYIPTHLLNVLYTYNGISDISLTEQTINRYELRESHDEKECHGVRKTRTLSIIR